jgi:hypothetical protein
MHLSKNKPRALAQHHVARGRTYTSGLPPCQTLSAGFPQLPRSCAKSPFGAVFPHFRPRRADGAGSGRRPARAARSPARTRETHRGNALTRQASIRFLHSAPRQRLSFAAQQQACASAAAKAQYACKNSPIDYTKRRLKRPFFRRDCRTRSASGAWGGRQWRT